MAGTFPDIVPGPGLIEIPRFDNTIIKYSNKVEQRISKSNAEEWKFILKYPSLTNSDKNTIQQFFLAKKGNYESFTFNHPLPSETIGTDGLNYRCILTHTAAADNRPITGASWETYWELGGSQGILWTAGDKYKKNFTVRFEQPLLNFEYFHYLLWRCNTVELLEVAA